MFFLLFFFSFFFVFFLDFSIFFSYTLALPSKIIHHRGLGSPLTLELLHTLQLTILMTRIKIIETLGVLLKIFSTYGGNNDVLPHYSITLVLYP